MPRSPADNQQIKDARRTDILRAATRVFAKKGFSDAKISDVAKEAGLSHGLVYHYFENKDAVFKAILEDKICRAREAMSQDDSRPGTSLDRMRTSLGHWLERVQAEPEMSILITQAMVSNAITPEAREMMRDHIREAYASSIARIAQGQREGAIGDHASAEELASCLMCFMRGLALTTMVDFGVKFTMPRADTVARLMVPTQALAALALDTNAAKPQRRAARIARVPGKKKKPARKAAR
jgi:AcrR family transcriptional regulator